MIDLCNFTDKYLKKNLNILFVCVLPTEYVKCSAKHRNI